MTFRSILSPRLSRWAVAATAGITIALAAGAYTLLSGSAGASKPTRAIRTASLSAFRAAVIDRMHGEHLDYRWVACVPTQHVFHGVRVVRCNVDFGEPHIVAYCSVLRGGRLLTNQDDAAIPCGHDDAGFSAPVVQYG
jgi:hypothetical protein